MSEPVTATAAQLYADLREKAPHLREAVRVAREEAIAYLAAKREFDMAYNQAYLDAQGSIPEREAKATIATIEERKALDEALERKRHARLDVDAWESILRGYSDVAQLAKQEVRSLS